MTEETAFPLYWPQGIKRTGFRRRAGFKEGRAMLSLSQAINRLEVELGRFGRSRCNLDRVVISTNIQPKLSLRGAPISVSDPGVAVYFELDGERRCIPCDKWDRVPDNIAGIAAAIGALRGIERWVNDANVRAAFKGFAALPDPNRVDWRAIFGIKNGDQPGAEEIRRKYRTLAAERHPDKGGSEAAMMDLNRARDQALKEVTA